MSPAWGDTSSMLGGRDRESDSSFTRFVGGLPALLEDIKVLR